MGTNSNDMDSKFDAEAFNLAANAVSEARDAEVFLYSGRIESPQQKLMTAFSTMEGRHPNAFLVLVTYGGDPHIAYKIARALQRGFERITVCVPGPCVSAGTMLALAAHELTMTDSGWLGPLDIQVPRSDEIFESQSGLASMQSLATLQSGAWETFRDNLFNLKASTVGQIKLKTSLEAATALTTGLYGPLFAQVDPLRLAEDERSKRIVAEYGRRLQLRSGNLQGEALQRLVADYPSHQFVIDRDEAKESLFQNVASPLPAEQLLVDALGILADRPLDEPQLLRYPRSGEPKEGGDRGHQDSEADEVDPGNRDRQHEEDVGVHETAAREHAENSPKPSKGRTRAVRSRVARVN